MCHSSTRSTRFEPWAIADTVTSPVVMDGLTEHFGDDQRGAERRDVESLAVGDGVHAHDQSGWNPAVLVDDRPSQHRSLTDLDVRQDHAVLDRRIVLHADAREQQRSSYGSTADDAPARNEGIERRPAP